MSKKQAGKESRQIETIRITGAPVDTARLAAQMRQQAGLIQKGIEPHMKDLEPLLKSLKESRSSLSGLVAGDFLRADQAITDMRRRQIERQAKVEQATLTNADATIELVKLMRLQASVLEKMEANAEEAERTGRFRSWVAITVGAVGALAATVAAVVGIFLLLR